MLREVYVSTFSVGTQWADSREGNVNFTWDSSKHDLSSGRPIITIYNDSKKLYDLRDSIEYTGTELSKFKIQCNYGALIRD